MPDTATQVMPVQFAHLIPGTVTPGDVSLEVAPDGALVFVTSGELQSFDPRRNEVNWSFQIPGGEVGDNAPFLRLSADTVFVSASPFLYAVDLASGQLRWQKQVGSDAPNQFLAAPNLVPAELAGAFPEMVVVATSPLELGLDDGGIFAYRTSDGAELWSDQVLQGLRQVRTEYYAGTAEVETGGNPVRIGPGLVFASAFDSGSLPAPPATLVALDVRTGEEVWRPDGAIPHILSPPICGNGSVYYIRLVETGTVLEGFNLDRLGGAATRVGDLEDITLGGLEDFSIDQVNLVADDGVVYYANTRGELVILRSSGPERLRLADTALSGPLVYTNENGNRRALLVGGRPPDQHAFFILVALPLDGSPNFVQSEVDDYHAVGQLRMNPSLFAAVFVQERDTQGPGNLISIDLTTL